MPPSDENGVDLRPIGATAGAALPTLSLLEYLLRTLPKYRKLVNEAPDWTRADGNVDTAQMLKTLRPGDFGLSGLQRSNDGPLVNFLIQGSGATSGGPGIHAQMVGPYIQAPFGASRTPEGGKPPSMPFLVNDDGEVFSPALARNRRKFIEEDLLQPNVKHLAFEGGGDRYGILKSRLNALSRQLREGKTTGGLDPAEAAKAVSRRNETVEKLKGLLGKDQTSAFFTNTPQAKMRRVMDDVRALADNPASPESLAKKERMQALADLFKRRGTKASPGIADEITKAIELVGRPERAQLPRSTLFKPKAFERFIPTLHHGGAALEKAKDPIFTYLAALPVAAQKEYALRNGISLQMLRKLMPKNFVRENIRAMAAGRIDARKKPYKFNASEYGGLDNIYDDAMRDRSQFFSQGYYSNQPRGTIYVRPDAPTNLENLSGSLNREVNKGYASTAAIGAGAKEVLGINMLRRKFPWLQKIPFIGGRGQGSTCWGNHCGSMVSKVLDDVGAVKPQLSHMDVLPSTLLTRPGVKILGITNKPLVQKGLNLMARNRTLLGLGAAGLMGAAGYGAGAVGNALKAPPAKPLPPKLDPHMFAKAMTLLKPPQPQA